jgi:hypothetical protein
MRTLEVAREFRDRCRALAAISTVPEVKWNLQKLAVTYERQVEELERIESASIVPEQSE